MRLRNRIKGSSGAIFHFLRKPPRGGSDVNEAWVDTVVANYNFLGRHAISEKFLLLHFRSGDNLGGAAPERFSKAIAPKALEAEAPINRPVHAHRLNHVGYSASPAEVSNGRAEQIIKTVEMDDVKFCERSAAKSHDARIERERAIAQPGGKVNGLDSILNAAPTEAVFFRCGARSKPFCGTEICGENRYFMPALRKFPREGADFHGEAAFGEIRKVGLGHV